MTTTFSKPLGIGYLNLALKLESIKFGGDVHEL
jgi:hypothetical protein